jgi:cytochrome P450
MSVPYEPKDPSVIADPFPALRRLQAEDPIHWSRTLASWVLTRYDHVKMALNDPRFSADRISPFLDHEKARGTALGELGRTVGLWAVFNDPPQHTRLRAVMNRGFTSRAVESLRPRVEEIVDALLERVLPTGRIDLIRDFAYPLPITVIGDLIGVARDDAERLKQWSDDLAGFVGSAVASPDKYARATQSVREMGDYFRRLADARRARPSHDIMSALIATGRRDDALSEDEVVATCMLLLFAGHETTTNVIGNGVLALMRHPDQCEAWRDDPSLTATAIDELLRYDGPGQALVRIATTDVVLDGQRLARGDRVFLMINAANRDPRRFADPDRLDLRRDPNPHITFGHGIHYCVGAPLARLEIAVAMPALLRRLPELTVTDAPLSWIDSLVFRGVRSLPATFRAGAR